jgi:hypothetical protein
LRFLKSKTLKNTILFFLLSILTISCLDTGYTGPQYEDIGIFNNRAEAENSALKIMIENNSKIYKNEKRMLLYTFKSKDNRPRNAIHYDIVNQELHLEGDPGSGYSATWDSISVNTIQSIVDLNGDLRDLQRKRKLKMGSLWEDSHPY